MKKGIVWLVVIVVVVIAGFIFLFGKDDKPTIGGSIHNTQESFDEGIAVDGTTIIDGSGNWDGAVTGSTGSFSSTFSAGGASTFSDLVSVSDTASSTVKIGSTADGVGAGCLILGDSGSATATPVYITATGATITATTTRPAICSSN